jgi:hypothetical protein
VFNFCRLAMAAKMQHEWESFDLHPSVDQRGRVQEFSAWPSLSSSNSSSPFFTLVSRFTEQFGLTVTL